MSGRIRMPGEEGPESGFSFFHASILLGLLALFIAAVARALFALS